MKALLLVLLTFLMVSQINTACSDGFFASIGNPDAAKGNCTACLPFCLICLDTFSCMTAVDKLKGVDRTVIPQAPICAFAGATWLGSGYGYNKDTDSCDRCKDGCQLCVVDYDKCVTCQAGWDMDWSNYQCKRATLGLSSTVLALSVLVFIFNIVTCACACKL